MKIEVTTGMNSILLGDVILTLIGTALAGDFTYS
jgi:hypothetical protein